MRTKSHEDLEVYGLAFGAAMRIFEITRDFPTQERYSLTDQIRRSSRSVCANIAEAYRKRVYPKSFVVKINDSESEAAETQVWIRFSASCGYIPKEPADDLMGTYDHIIGKLVKMRDKPEIWTLPSSRKATSTVPEQRSHRRETNV